MGQRLVIKDFIRKMLPLKKIVIEIEAPTELSYYSHNSNAQDILMIFSLSGNVDNIVSQVALFKQKQVRIVGVSQLGQSVLSDLSDFNLYYQSQVFASEMDTYVSFLPIHYLTDLIILAYKNQSDNEELS
ncbi:SIS domain-containing protein [Ignavigranum ruoffiae]|nr:SIS domain-containing protein [Ignavigranum ruoffiae]